jgi:Protein of unknown function (DUF2958)
MKTSVQQELMSADIAMRLEELGYQQTSNPIMVAKFINPCGTGAWYVSDFTANIQTISIYYMAAEPDEDEWLDMFVSEFQAMRCPPLGLSVVRDMTFTECRFSELERPQ